MASDTPKEYMVGLGVSSRGKVMVWARDPHAPRSAGVKDVLFERMETLVPRDVRARLIEIESSRDVSTVTTKAVCNAVVGVAYDVGRRPNLPSRPSQAVAIMSGQVTTHCDGCGCHRALILRPGPMTLALFVTSNPRWSRRARRLSDDEAALLGKPIGDVNYFAPVIREASDFIPSKTVFPSHRTEALLIEFFDPERS